MSCMGEMEPADKPGSDMGSHSSGIRVTAHLKRSTRELRTGRAPGDEAPAFPYSILLRMGFTLPPRVTTGAVRSYRTFSPLPDPKAVGGIFSVALSVGSRRPGITWHPALRSPDFPPLRHKAQGATAWPTPSGIIDQPLPAG